MVILSNNPSSLSGGDHEHNTDQKTVFMFMDLSHAKPKRLILGHI